MMRNHGDEKKMITEDKRHDNRWDELEQMMRHQKGKKQEDNEQRNEKNIQWRNRKRTKMFTEATMRMKTQEIKWKKRDTWMQIQKRELDR